MNLNKISNLRKSYCALTADEAYQQVVVDDVAADEDLDEVGDVCRKGEQDEGGRQDDERLHQRLLPNGDDV